MARCRCVTLVNPLSEFTWANRKVCPRAAKAFYRVRYDMTSMSEYHARTGKGDDVFGFCPDHAQAFSRRSAYDPADKFIGMNVVGLRGSVVSVEFAQGEGELREDELARQRSTIRAIILRQMEQKGNQNLSPDDWQAIFEDLVREYTVRFVLKG